MNKDVIAAHVLIQEDDVEPVYTELKRENEDDKSKMYTTLCYLCAFVILYTLIFLPGENFHQFHPLLSLAKFLSHEFFVLY